MRAAAVRRLPLFKPGRVSPSTRPVPAHIPKPDYALNGGMPLRQAHELAPAVFALDSPVVPALRAAGQLAARALAYSSTLVRPGATTDSIDEKVHAFLVQHSAYPSPLLYMSFPKSCCTSVNDVIVHGIPDSRPLLEGDVCKVDISCYLEGVHGDNCATFCVGEVDPAVRRMVDFARQVLDECVELCGPGVAFNDLGRHISKRCAAQGFRSSETFCGHGIGPSIHMQPMVYHFDSPRNDTVMRPGHVFTIEPAICEGSPAQKQLPDGWTEVTKDGGWSAQFEHMVLITEEGKEVLTRVAGE